MSLCHLTLRGRKPPPPNYPTELETIGDHILRRRLDLGLTQREVADQFGANQWTIINWESNRTTPRLRFVPKVIEFLGYNPYEPQSDALGERIRRRRECLGLSQRELSTILGIDAKTLYEWEKGIHQPSMKLRARVDAFLKPNRSMSHKTE